MSTVFVANLPFRLTAEEFSKEFARFGPVANARIMTRMFRGRRVPRGFGFVDFQSPDGMRAALAATDVTVGGRKLRIAEARPRPVVLDNVFIANIAQDADETKLMAHFNQYHPRQAKIVMKKESEERRGFGYVQVASQQDRDAAVAQLDGKDFCGLPLLVKVARKPFLGEAEVAARAERRLRRRGRRAPRNATPSQ